MSAQKTNGGRRVVIVDDHPLLRQGLERLITATDSFKVCGEAANAAEAINLVGQTRPDVAIVDVGLPDMDGITLTSRLKAAFPELRVLIFSMHDGIEYARRAFAAGATGYMVKQDAIEKIARALLDVASGRRYLSESIAAQM